MTPLGPTDAKNRVRVLRTLDDGSTQVVTLIFWPVPAEKRAVDMSGRRPTATKAARVIVPPGRRSRTGSIVSVPTDRLQRLEEVNQP